MKCNVVQFLRHYRFKKNKQKSAFPEIMIPLVSTEAEIKIMKDLVIKIAKEVQKEKKKR